MYAYGRDEMKLQKDATTKAHVGSKLRETERKGEGQMRERERDFPIYGQGSPPGQTFAGSSLSHLHSG